VVRAGQAKISAQTTTNAPPPTPQTKTDNVSHHFVTLNDTIFANTLTKTVIGAVILKTIVITYAHKIFTLLLINDQNVNKSSAEMNFSLTKSIG
jgi:multisubunit Na+/H+ antiporter MnhC subunit